MLLEVRLMQSRRGEREFATPKFWYLCVVVWDCGLVWWRSFSPQIRNYAPNMIQKRKESASLVKGGTIIENIPPKGEIFSDFIATFTMSVGFDTYFDLQR